MPMFASSNLLLIMRHRKRHLVGIVDKLKYCNKLRRIAGSIFVNRGIYTKYTVRRATMEQNTVIKEDCAFLYYDYEQSP
jgi:hypothetical protein